MIRVPSSSLVSPSNREGSHVESDGLHSSNGIRSWGSHSHQRALVPLSPSSPSSRWITRSLVIILYVTSPPPLSLSHHALVNQFRISLTCKYVHYRARAQFLFTSSPSLFPPLFPSLLASIASIETSTTVVFLSCILSLYSKDPPAAEKFDIQACLVRFPATLFSIRMGG